MRGHRHHHKGGTEKCFTSIFPIFYVATCRSGDGNMLNTELMFKRYNKIYKFSENNVIRVGDKTECVF